MKIIKNSDIKFRINKKLVYLPNFTIRFYTINQKEYFLEKTQDDLVEYEREATVDDADVILSGGTTVTEYYLPLNWNQLMFVGKGVLNYKLTNNIEDPEFPDYQYNKEEIVTTDFYIDSIEVDPEPEEGLIERIVLLEEHLAEEIVNREEADATITENLNAEEARAISAETVLDEKIDAETNRATSAETALDTKLDQEIADRQTDVNAEEARAISAETALDAKIDKEIQDRKDDVDAEETRATTAESALTDAINAESNRAISAETELSNAITNETNRATSAETALNEALTDEVNRATTAETTLDERIVAETNRATSAETALNEALQAETNRATSAEAALDVKIDTVSGNVISETSRAITAENALSGAIDSLDVRFFDDAKYEDSGNTKVINFYNGNVVKATIDASDFIVDGMVEDVRIENGYLVIDFNTASGKQDIQIPLTDIFNPNNYYTKSETSGATEIATALAQKLNISDFNTYSGAVDTLINSKASQSDLDALNGVVTAHTADTTVHVTTSDKTKWNKVDDKLDVTDFNTYSGSVDTRLAEDEEVTSRALNALNEAVSGKVNTSDFEAYSGTVDTALAAKQDTLIAGENITISGNVISAVGGGGSITVDPSLDSGSTNPVANSAITNAINSKMDEVNLASFYGNEYYAGLKGYYYDLQTETQTQKFDWGVVWQSDGSIGFDAVGNLTVFNKLDTSAITTSVTSSSTDAQVPSAKAVNDKLGGLSIVKLTQAQYDALATKDNNTLYVIVG